MLVYLNYTYYIIVLNIHIFVKFGPRQYEKRDVS